MRIDKKCDTNNKCSHGEKKTKKKTRAVGIKRTNSEEKNTGRQ